MFVTTLGMDNFDCTKMDAHFKKFTACLQEGLIYEWKQALLAPPLPLMWLHNSRPVTHSHSSAFLVYCNIVQCILGYPNFDYPNTRLSECKISQATPTLRKPRGSWRLQKGIFLSSKATRSAENVLIILNICKFMATDRSYTKHCGSRRLTTVAKS